MTAFEREYRELGRLKGVSLRDDVLLYKITPEIPSIQECQKYWGAPHVEQPVLRITEAEPGKIGTAVYCGMVFGMYVVIPAILIWIIWRVF